MLPQRFDEHWLYPEVTRQLSLAIRDLDVLETAIRLIERGRLGPIRKWLKASSLPDVARRLIRVGLAKNDTGGCPLLFDEIVLAIQSL